MALDTLWTVTLLILVAFIPTIVFMAWFRASGKRMREPWSVVILSYTFGAIGAIIIALALEMMGSNASVVRDLVTHRFELEEIREAFETAADKTQGAIKVAVTQ